VNRARLAVIVIASFLALPAIAHASNPVRRHLAAGRAALAEARHAALAGHAQATSADAAKSARSGRFARRAANRLHSKPKRAKALKRVAAFDDDSLDTFAAIIDEAPPSTQDEVGDALDGAAGAREQVIGLLTELLPDLPEDVQAQIADAISSFESDGDIDALLQALASGELTDQASQLVTQLVDELSGDLNDLMDQLAALEAELPTDQAAALEAAIADLQTALDGAGETLDQVLEEILLGGGDLSALCGLVTQLQVTLPIDVCPA
jgi:DNA repair exonuclease SbcCD ATPase subunit